MQLILEPGSTLRNRYEISELVGQGGMGAVYRALDTRLDGRVCAIKEILPAITLQTQSDDALEQMSAQFHTEASVLARLDHPNLPKVSDYFTDGEREYLVMDFVAGRELQEIIREAERRNEKLPESDVLNWAHQLLDAVGYLHAQDPPVIHRDIKPANIKVTPHGVVKLVDFGLVKMLQEDESRTVTVVQGRGTVAYTPIASSLVVGIAPASLRGVYLSVNSMCWAVGYLIGPPLGGWALDHTAAHTFWLWLMASTLVGVAILALLQRHIVTQP